VSVFSFSLGGNVWGEIFPGGNFLMDLMTTMMISGGSSQNTLGGPERRVGGNNK